MELERGKRDFERRLEEGRAEIRKRLERVEQCCKEAEEARRRDWEKLEGRLMTAEEKRQHDADSLQRLMARMTEEYVNIVRAASEDIKQEFAEGRAESRGQTEALLKMMDRLPPD